MSHCFRVSDAYYSKECQELRLTPFWEDSLSPSLELKSLAEIKRTLQRLVGASIQATGYHAYHSTSVRYTTVQRIWRVICVNKLQLLNLTMRSDLLRLSPLSLVVCGVYTHIADPSYDSFVFIYDSLGHTSVLVRRVCQKSTFERRRCRKVVFSSARVFTWTKAKRTQFEYAAEPSVRGAYSLYNLHTHFCQLTYAADRERMPPLYIRSVQTKIPFFR